MISKLAKGMLIVLGLVILVIVVIEETRAPARAAQQSDALREARFDIAMQGATLLLLAARNPDSFRVARVVSTDGGRTVCYVYRAQNGFGGMNVSRAVLADTLLVEGSAGFRGAWRAHCAGTGEDVTEDVASGLRQYRAAHPD